jgi:hypothetical protein
LDNASRCRSISISFSRKESSSFRLAARDAFFEDLVGVLGVLAKHARVKSIKWCWGGVHISGAPRELWKVLGELSPHLEALYVFFSGEDNVWVSVVGIERSVADYLRLKFALRNILDFAR